MAGAALESVVEWSVDRIAATVEPLTTAVVTGAGSLGLSVYAEPHAGHIVGLKLPLGSPGPVAESLAAADVHVSVRGDSLRVSPYVFNTDGDVARLVQALSAAV